MKYTIFLLVVTSVLVESKGLYDSSQPCRKNDPNFKNCFADLIERTASRLINSVSESNTPSMDPYVIPYVYANVDLKNIAEGEVLFKNLKFTNILRMKVTDASMDVDNLSALINIVHPNLKWKFEFDANGTLFNSPLQAEANIVGNFDNYKSNFRIKLKTVESKGVKYFTIDNLKLDFSIEDGSLQMTTKDANYQPILNFAQNIFNQNPKQFIELTKPISIKHIERIMKSIMEAIFSTIPANMILSE